MGKCSQCSKEILNTQQCYDEMESKGLKVNRSTGTVSMSGVFGSLDSFEENQQKIKQICSSIEDKRGYQCTNCKNVYCVSCLALIPTQ
jgi:hypothetical protein